MRATLRVIVWALLAVGQHTRAADNPRWNPPSPDTIPPGPLGDSVRLGQLIFTQTPKYAPRYVGNQLSCSHCHLGAGTARFAAPVVGLPGMFPMFDKRANRVITFAERIQECFVRSENGRPQPFDGPEMTALIAYVQWLSQGQPAGQEFPGRGLVHLSELTPNLQRGENIYMQQCSGCHGKDGAGMPPTRPPLWGPGAYNDGAGMNGVSSMAAFVRHNMPANKPGSLSAQDSFDVAAFIHSKPHPVFNRAYASY
ncbi:MAG TPA: c-type cytochrome [Bryobacteraceae bacterium]|nr:c-type cytochrome [Bryobacteraceae bacterium]